MTAIDDEKYLRKKGWEKRDTASVWAWTKPPLAARYTLKDAVAVQQSLDKEKKK
jgi:hypothetical protein